MNSQTPSSQPVISIGIDWADCKHDAWIVDPRGGQEHATVEHDPAAIATGERSRSRSFNTPSTRPPVSPSPLLPAPSAFPARYGSLENPGFFY